LSNYLHKSQQEAARKPKPSWAIPRSAKKEKSHQGAPAGRFLGQQRKKKSHKEPQRGDTSVKTKKEEIAASPSGATPRSA